MPLVARGVIVRRPRVVGLLDRIDADRRAVRRLQRLRARYGEGPLRLAAPGREIALVLAPRHVLRVLDGAPEPFAPASMEKRAALSHFEPHGVLVSSGPERADRRRFNEEALDTGRPVHRLGPEIAARVAEEAGSMLEQARRAGALSWDVFAGSFWRIVRRVVLGDSAREDHVITDLLASLRADANWSYMKPQRRRLREAFLRRLAGHVERAEPGSLASMVASTPASPQTYPVEQVPQWLFAFDAAGMAAFRTLALLDAHAEVAAQALAEVQGAGLADAPELPLLRASMLESLRLWPTTPAVLRDATADTEWENGTLRSGAGLVIFAPFFHRDGERLPFADRFDPGVWADGRTVQDWPLIPFSAGPGQCPGRNVVLLTTSLLLAHLLRARPRQAAPAALDSAHPMPATLSPFRLRFEVAAA